jgi:hypothetical protein
MTSANEVFLRVKPLEYRKLLLPLCQPTIAMHESFCRRIQVSGALTRFLNDQNAMAVISAGFLRTSTPATPAGLLKYQAQLYNELSMSDPVLGAAVCFSGGIKSTNVQIVSREDSETIQKASDCFQAGPLLISNGLVDADLDKLDGETNKFSSGIYARSFLLVNKHGNIVLGYSPASSLLVLRSLMLLPEAAGGLEAVSAVGFTGAETAGLLVTGKEPRKFGEVTLPLPDAIAIGQISHTPAQD